MDYYYNVKKTCDFIKNNYISLSKEVDYFFALSLTTLLFDIYDSRKKYKNEYKKLINELKIIKYKNNEYIPLYKKIMIFFTLHHMMCLVKIAKKIVR